MKKAVTTMKHSSRHPRPERVAVYLDEAENALVAEAAALQDLPLSAYARRILVRAAREEVKQQT